MRACLRLNVMVIACMVTLLSGAVFAVDAPIADAARSGDLERVKSLTCMVTLLSGAVFAVDAPIADAARSGDLERVRSLIGEGADVGAAHGDGMTGLHWAAKGGYVEIAKLLIASGADVQAGTLIGAYMPLHVASEAANLAVVKMLLEAGAEVNVRVTSSGASPLHLAATAAGGEAVVVALLDAGADVNAREAYAEQTPLMFAAANNRTASVSKLIERGADPALSTIVVDVATRVAQDRRGHEEFQQILAFIEGCGLKPNLVQEQMAIREVRSHLDDELQPSERWGAPTRRDHDNVLERHGQYLSIREVQVGKWGGSTALLYAARDGKMDAAMALLDGGANIDQVSGGDGVSPLLAAAMNGHFDLVLRLLKRGADPNPAATNDGITPLFAVINTRWGNRSEYPQPRAHDIAEADYLQVAEALLKAGANPNARLTKNLWSFDHNHILGQELTGATPMWRAAFAMDVKMLRLLGSYGADPNIPVQQPELGMRLGRMPDSRTDDDSGLPILPAGTPDTYPVQMAAGAGHVGFAASALHQAPNGALESVKYLVEEFSVDVNVKDSWGYTPLHYAAAWAQDELVSYLVSKGADVQARTRLGQTVLDMAMGGYRSYYMAEYYPETAKLLESLGATVECPDLHFGGTGYVCPGAVANGATDYRALGL
jgi:ankyrin repeat protein